MSDLIILFSSGKPHQTPAVGGDSRDDAQQVVRIAQALANSRPGSANQSLDASLPLISTPAFELRRLRLRVDPPLRTI
jgi:hypothetical protein